ncbi:Alpha/beta hydrolase family protein [Thiothrix caldifontis]|uniref:Alpha/beta hydrolase family protein n=1 Tax=Thiothrix caldifontis TaxID=525918 RepID=A0A1H3ZCQ0_9GAMM|nr:lipase [Thiothrix caldifontis]SEA21420.1 Alpha/beta hydrolase family protein [Thiothrix caldifontis]
MKLQLLSRNILLALAVSGLGACGDSSDYDFSANANGTTGRGTAVARFDPRSGVIPQTNDLLLAGSTDGTLNIPTATITNPGQLGLVNSLNTLDGFGLTAPITAAFGASLKAGSLQTGSSVRVFEVRKDVATQAITGVVREVTAAELLATAVGTQQDTLALVPLKPLKESTSYLVVLTNAIQGSDGRAATSDSAYLLAKSTTALSGEYAALEPLRQLINNQEAIAANQGVSAATIVLSWSFTTQSVTPVLEAMQRQAAASPLLISPTLGASNTFVPALAGKANVHIGTLDVPYYLTAPSTANPTAPLTTAWSGAAGSFLTRYNPAPVATSTQTVPVLMSVPNASALAGATPPAGGWPVVIFQHGITRNRQDLLAVADTLADAGYVGIAIDLPLHGVTEDANPLRADKNAAFANDVERTFNLDVQNASTGTAGADGVIDSSGTHFINLGSLLTSRDNIRQGIADLLVLRRSLGNITAVPLNTAKVGFVGHSLGGVIGTGYLAAETAATPASLVTTGGGIARLLDGSASFGPVIQAGLGSAGLTPGSAAYDAFMVVAQTVIDPADPVVLGAQAAAKHPVHMIEVLGDQVIPNRVTGAPLSGTEPLASVMQLTSRTATAAGEDGIVRFNRGAHSSVLDPGVNLAVTVEMQRQIAAFQLAGGAAIAINDSTVIAGAAP